jgi:hypothetical protein
VIRPRRLLPVLAGASLLVASLAGCAGTVSMDAAEDANDPVCANISVNLPQSVSGEQRRWTDAQATGAWGSPASVLLTCGVEVPGPTEEQCITLGGVDWIIDDSQAPRYTATTYGRVPAIQLFIDNETVSPNDVLDQFGTLIDRQIPPTAACISTETLLPDQTDQP